jgi:UDP-N-acetylmuramoyl-tripeptide--D-alanyl-D-alanine ligase
MAKKRKTFRKLRDILAYARRRLLFRTTFIGVTGSCGKSSTTIFIDHLLGKYWPGRSGAFHNIRGRVSLSIMHTGLKDRYLVQEVSGHQPGAIATAMPLLKPDIAIVTTVGQDHYTNFRSLEKTAKEKSSLVSALGRSGTAILNADDPNVIPMRKQCKGRVISFGKSEQAELRATDISNHWPDRLSFSVNYAGKTARIETALFGEIWITSILAAIACGLAMGLSLDDCSTAIKGLKPVTGRMSIYRDAGGTDYITDTFKAPFWTVEPAINALKNAKAEPITLVIGSLSDVPGTVSKKYRDIAKMGLEVADRCIFVGSNARRIDKLIPNVEAGRLLAFESVVEANRHLSQTATPGELVFIKSNRLEHLERLAHSRRMTINCWKEQCQEFNDCSVCADRESHYSSGSGTDS